MEHDPWYNLATTIRRERERHGLSTTDLARLVDVSRTTIHNWESGKPIPIERCATLAGALGVPYEDLIALHPYAPARPSPATESVAQPQLGRRLLIAAGSTLLLIVIGAVVATWQLANINCVEAGAGGGSMLGPFRTAYDNLGGETRMGCAVNEVHKRGPGYVQMYEGGTEGRSVLTTVDRRQVFFVPADVSADYDAIITLVSPDVVGAIASDVLTCGEGRLVPLQGGWGSGALVESSSGRQFVWLEADLWIAYASVGGPLGPLGRPLDDGVERSEDGELALFEGGGIVRRYGQPPEVNLSEGSGGSDAFALSACVTSADSEDGV